MEKNTAGKSVVTQVAKTLKSRVNVITWHVRSRLGSSLREVPLAWPAENDRVDRPCSRHWKEAIAEVMCRRSINCETHKTESVPFSFWLPNAGHGVGGVRRASGAVSHTTTGSSGTTCARTVAATGCNDRPITECAGRASRCRSHP